MQIGNRVFTAGIWKVKPGKEKDFAEAWQAFADWTVKNIDGAIKARLFRDMENPGTFLSIGPWQDVESINQWRNTAEFSDFINRAREICDSIEPHTMHPVAMVEKPGFRAA